MEHPQKRTRSPNHKLIQQRQLVATIFHTFDQIDDQGFKQVDEWQNIIAIKVLILQEVLEGAHPEIGLECHEE